MKKIIPALALLLISAMVLASASYAWFSMNTTVTATGMNVKAQADASLSIKKTTDPESAYNSTVNFELTSTKLDPVHYHAGDSSKVAFYAIGAANDVNNPDDEAATVPFATYIGNPSTYADKFTDVSDDSDDYVQDDATMNLKVTGNVQASTKKITGTVSAAVTVVDSDGDDDVDADDVQDIYKALYVLLVVKDDADNELGRYLYNDAAGTYANGVVTVTYTVQDVVATANVVTDAVFEVDAYVFFDGEDPDCYTSNAILAQNIAVSLRFDMVPNA